MPPDATVAAVLEATTTCLCCRVLGTRCSSWGRDCSGCGCRRTWCIGWGQWRYSVQGLVSMSRSVSHHPTIYIYIYIGGINSNRYGCCGDVSPKSPTIGTSIPTPVVIFQKGRFPDSHGIIEASYQTLMMITMGLHP